MPLSYKRYQNGSFFYHKENAPIVNTSSVHDKCQNFLSLEEYEPDPIVVARELYGLVYFDI